MPKPLFQSEAECKAIVFIIIIIIPMQIEIFFFFKEDLALSWKWEFFWSGKWPIEYCLLLYDWVRFCHAIGQFAVRNLPYGPKFLKKMLISEV